MQEIETIDKVKLEQKEGQSVVKVGMKKISGWENTETREKSEVGPSAPSPPICLKVGRRDSSS